ncbi:hypothetical protein MPLDJ20_60677 [Mesorhizobium plurifarium]|uniref:Uncharacterized protein n=1 Tax=Mesorhizobium plurifarium TaxID=69974 RepID=A0A090FSL7_MESPL|nr:hypothetical protein MPLDJ20_60677 [Mesorhizobium plurifarium]
MSAANPGNRVANRFHPACLVIYRHIGLVPGRGRPVQLAIKLLLLLVLLPLQPVLQLLQLVLLHQCVAVRRDDDLRIRRRDLRNGDRQHGAGQNSQRVTKHPRGSHTKNHAFHIVGAANNAMADCKA